MEAQVKEQAKKDLYWAAEAFTGCVMPYIFKGPRVIQVLRELPEIEYLIGYGLDKPRGNDNKVSITDYPIPVAAIKSSRVFTEPYNSVVIVEPPVVVDNRASLSNR